MRQVLQGGKMQVTNLREMLFRKMSVNNHLVEVRTWEKEKVAEDVN